MPSEENDLDEAYSRYGKRLKSKEAAQDPTKDEELRTRLEQVDRQSSKKSELFTESDTRLEQLKEEFQIEVQIPQTLSEYVVYLLAQGQMSSPSAATVALADLFSETHEVEQFRKISQKEFQKTLKQLEKAGTIQLKEIQGTLVVKLRDEFLSEDEATILDVAARKDGKASLEQIMLSTGWTQARVQIALEALISKNMVVRKTSFTRGTRYQVPNDP
jgi:DNA-binding MarR family transcriptional regulator